MKVELNSNLITDIFTQESKEKQNDSFSKVLKNFLKEVNQEQLAARDVEKALSEGRVKNVEEALFTIEKADLSLRLLTEIRNKALESYQEIMRMQV
ncbi:flagellar hook-basal body complex protein FliE [Desulfurobacterium sp.]|uniref:flagellar hook-basal body complex protein FliE n=1 Tax=Desulfurobacterium sp. TaxID=2004706 RepID=UPI0026089ED6|nr:flagellar hook-basal body complex protein FliE [Desulfurobacterium sp.]